MFATLATAFLAASAVLGAPTAKRSLTVSSSNGPTVPNSYIVKLKRSATLNGHSNRLPFGLDANDESSPVTHNLNIINGYAGVFAQDTLDTILADADVEAVYPNGIVSNFRSSQDSLRLTGMLPETYLRKADRCALGSSKPQLQEERRQGRRKSQVHLCLRRLCW